MIDKVSAGYRIGVGAALAAALGGPAAAQTDYYNTDKGRPVRVEDAYPVERHAFELQIAPLRLERTGGGVYSWEVAPEVAWGVLPRTQFELAFPLAHVDAGAARNASGLAGIELSALYNLNNESRTLPALAIAADVLLPVGGLGPDRAYPTLKGIATRTFSRARFHANAEYTLGPDAGEGEEVGEASRWMAGIAVDRTFPIRSILVTADLFAERALDRDESLSWTAEAGLRYQTSPQFNVDLGIGRRFAGEEQGWSFSVGVAHAFALRTLLPGR
ncbi:MAG TPA: hypothetical protein VF647_24695 [Longimicrobium sp.]